MKKHHLTLWAFYLTLLCIGALCACGRLGAASLPPGPSKPEVPPPVVWDPVPEAVAALADKKIDVNTLAALDKQVTRDDLGITVSIPPYRFQELVTALEAMELRPYQAGDPFLDIPKPFTLAFSYQGREYSYAFSHEKIVANGADAFPQNLGALTSLYELENRNRRGLLTQDIHYLRKDMPFAESDVASIELTSRSIDDERRVALTDGESIRAAMNSLGSLVVWKLDAEARPNPKTGGDVTCTFILTDGFVWRYETAFSRSVDSSGTETYYGEVPSDYGSLFIPLDDAPGQTHP